MSHVKRLVRRGRLLPVGMCAILAASVLAGSPASAAPVTPAPAKVPASFFGMHHLDPVNSWPAPRTTGSLRLWDVGVTWRDIETRPGRFDLTRLNTIVARAAARRTRVLLVLGQTPDFRGYSASRVPAAGTEYHGTGASTMPRKAVWQRYVLAIARKHGRSIDYQVWNEANVVGFWTGGMYNLARLTKWTREALNSPSLPSSKRRARLVAPPFGTRSNISAIGSYYKQKPEGYAVHKFVNAVALQLYPPAAGRPEHSMVLLASAKRYLAKYGVNKPIYNTEINYGFQSGPTPRAAAPISSRYEAAYASRTLVLNAANRISRVYWYHWTMGYSPAFGGSQANTLMVWSDGSTLSAAGKAWRVTRSWLVTTRPRGCTRDRNGTYTCKFQYATGTAMKRIIWNPTRIVTVRAPSYTNAYYKMDNVKRGARKGTRIRVGVVPVMIRSSR